ncbi:zinc ABC transporter substrate-binding protein [Vibrio sp. WJH972]
MPSWAITVLSSIKPIQMITHELTLGVADSEVLLDNNTSPHDYALRPSDIKKIHSADLIVWFGSGLEPFMDKILESVDEKSVLTVSQLGHVGLSQYGDDHEDDGHNHGTLDPHFWLGKEATLGTAQAIVDKLIILDGQNAEQYRSNLQRFNNAIEALAQTINTQLSPFNQLPYYVFHDAYGYFERDYQLRKLGRFTVSPERKPGAKTLVNIKRTLSETKGVCVFSEPQFSPAVINTVMRGTSAKLGTLDPLGSDVDVADGSYFELLKQLADEFERCFAVEQ